MPEGIVLWLERFSTMRKYKALVKQFVMEIDQIKRMREEARELSLEFKDLSHQINVLSYSGSDDAYLDRLEESLRNLEYDRGLLEENLEEAECFLNDRLQDAYEDVPFAKARNKAIAAFYREAGLE